nr:galactokinase [Hymenolepis microstoma]
MPQFEVPEHIKLLEAADNKFIEIFQSIPTVRVVAPGRVNLIGEHTDYNEGFVLPMALPLVTVMVSSPNNSGMCRIHTTAREEEERSTVNFPVGHIETAELTKGERWSGYVRGVIANMIKAGVRVPAFNAVIVSSVPIGAGLSSSASLEVATLLTCQKLADYDFLSIQDCAKICQKAECEWVHAPCGLMDQLASLGGVDGHALFIDCKTNDTEPIKTNFDGVVKVIIVNSGVHHRIAAGQYRIRRNECEELCRFFKVQSLRDLQTKISHLEDLCKEATENLSKTHANRLRHVLTENQRVVDARNAMQTMNLTQLGQIMCESHESMKNDYEVSCKEVDELIDIAMKVEGVYGARMTGGGFGGSIVVLAKPDAVNHVISAIDNKYSDKSKICVVDASFGARILPKQKERTRSTSKCD